jgi:hypothetical protein
MLFSYNSCQLDRLGLAFLWRNQQKSNSRETRVLKKMLKKNAVAK